MQLSWVYWGDKFSQTHIFCLVNCNALHPNCPQSTTMHAQQPPRYSRTVNCSDWVPKSIKWKRNYKLPKTKDIHFQYLSTPRKITFHSITHICTQSARSRTQSIFMLSFSAEKLEAIAFAFAKSESNRLQQPADQQLLQQQLAVSSLVWWRKQIKCFIFYLLFYSFISVLFWYLHSIIELVSVLLYLRRICRNISFRLMWFNWMPFLTFFFFSVKFCGEL